METDTPQVTAAEVIAKARELAAARPKHVYLTPSESDSVCSYYRDRSGEPGQGCLFGQALALLDITDPKEGESIFSVLLDHGIPCSDSDSEWLTAVQSSQDGGDPWGEAIRLADETIGAVQS